MDELTCRIVRPKTLSYQNIIEKSIHKEKITKVFEPNTFVKARFYRWKSNDIYENNSLEKDAEESLVCLTEVSPNSQDKDENDSSSLPKYHITIAQTGSSKDTLTSNTKFLSFLIDQDYMVNPSYVEITESMGCPYHITLIVDKKSDA